VLAIAGSADTGVPLSQFDVIVSSVGGTDHTYNIFTGDMSKFNELMSITTEWFLKKL